MYLRFKYGYFGCPAVSFRLGKHNIRSRGFFVFTKIFGQLWRGLEDMFNEHPRGRYELNNERKNLLFRGKKGDENTTQLCGDYVI